MIRKTFCVITLLLCLLVFTGCGQEEEVDMTDVTLGVLIQNDRGTGSEMTWYDKDLNVVGTTKYDFTGAYVSFTNAVVQDKKIYLAPYGSDEEKDYGKIVEIDPAAPSEPRYFETGRVNPIGLSVEGDKLVTTSNLNNEVFIDLIDLKSGEITTIDMELADPFIMEAILLNGKVYGSSVSSDANGEDYYTISLCDFARNTAKPIIDLQDKDGGPTFLERHGNDLVYLSMGKLVKYDTENETSKTVKLTRKDPYNINVAGDKLFIGYSDPFDDAYESLIEVRDYNTGKVLDSIEHQGNIQQLETNGTAVYVMGTTGEVTKYFFKEGKFREVKTVDAAEGHENYPGGMFYLPGE